jgi:DNA invertase Pin-like site-specific DNA recombinase
MRGPRWVGYLRVSTDEQLRGEGIEIQRDAIIADARAAGVSVIDWFSDEAVSGSNGLDKRNGIAEALGYLDAHPSTTLAVYRLDRLARDLIVQEQLLAEIWRAGGRVHSCSETEAAYAKPDDPDDPTRKFIRQVLGAAAEYERAMIRLRMVRGRRRAIAESPHGWAGGPPPYGYRVAAAGGLEPDEDEQAVLATIGVWRAEGWSWQSIADDLNERGWHKRNGTPWRKKDVHQTYSRVLRQQPPEG